MRGLLPLLLSVDAQRLIMSMGGVPYLLSPDATGAAACRTALARAWRSFPHPLGAVSWSGPISAAALWLESGARLRIF